MTDPCDVIARIGIAKFAGLGQTPQNIGLRLFQFPRTFRHFLFKDFVLALTFAIEHAHFEVVAYAVREFIIDEWLGDIIARAFLQSLQAHCGAFMRSQHDHRHEFAFQHALQLPHDVNTVHHRHFHVEQYQVVPRRRISRCNTRWIRGQFNVRIAMLAQHHFHQIQLIRIVIHHQNTRRANSGIQIIRRIR